MSYPEKLRELVELFEFMEERSERIQALIDTADRFVEVPAEVAERPFDEERKVPACESEAFVWSIPRADGTLDFHFAVENPQGISAKAMATILRETASGAPLSEVAEIPEDVPMTLFGRELSMGKNMGLMAMIAMVRTEAKRASG
ncbi:MAG: SufE family protein [Acidobacteriota bacterium]